LSNKLVVDCLDTSDKEKSENICALKSVKVKYPSDEIYAKSKILRDAREKFSGDFASKIFQRRKNEQINPDAMGSSETSYIFPRENKQLNTAIPCCGENFVLEMDVDLDSGKPMPGKGKKFIFKSICNNKIISTLVDTGSSTSLVSKSFIIDLNLNYYTSRVPINFLGMFGSKMVPDAKVATIVLDIGTNQIGVPAYIMEALPKDVDLIIGTDQLGKSLGISIDLNNSSFISFIDSKNHIHSYRLGENSELYPVINPSASTPTINDQTNLLPVVSNSSDLSPVINDSCNTLFASKLSSDKSENDNLTSNLEKKEMGDSVQMGVMPSSSFEKIALPNDRSIAVNIKNRQVDPTLLSIQMEVKGILTALEILQRDLEQLKSWQNIIPSTSRKSRSRAFDSNLFETDKKNLILRFDDLISALKRELNRLRKKYHNKVTRRHKNDKRNKREKMKAIKRSVHLIDQRYITIIPLDNKPQPPKVDLRGGPIFSSEDIIETIVDNGLFRNGKDPDLLIDEIKGKLALSDNNSTPDHYQEQLVNLVNIISEKLEENLPEMADWMNDVKRRDVLIHHHLLADEVERLNSLLGKFSSSVLLGPRDDLVMGQATQRDGSPIKYRIELIPEGLTILKKKKKKAYPIKSPMRNLLKSTAEEMQKAGVGYLNNLDFTASFTSPVFFVKNKAKFRLVCDYKDLNSVTQDDLYPIPHMDYIFQNLGNSNGTGKQPSYFSILDLKSGYYQIPLDEMAQKLAAVMLPFGIFQFICLPFGLKNAPAFFQRYMDDVLKDGLGNYVFVYIDDIVIFSDTFDNHLEHLNLVLGFLKQCNLKANLDKCHFCLSQLKVLGKIVSKDGLATDPELIRAMVEFPSPGNDIGNLAKKKLKRFLAMISYYRSHIQDFGPQTDLLSKLLKDDFYWDKDSWQVEHEQAFRHLKQLMLQAPVLAFPDMSKPFFMQSDASKVGAGAVLYQMNEQNHRSVVSYASWLFSDTQRRYNTTERELLGLILAVRKWKPFFHHTKFFAETDHEPLVGYLKLDDPYGKIARWAAELAQFSFQIKYIKGETNIPSDTLSRTGEEIASLESIYSCSIDEVDKYFAKNRLSKILSKSFNSEDIELYTCLETDIYDNIIFHTENICTNSLCFTMPTNQEWIKAQAEDPDLGPICTWLRSAALPAEEDLAFNTAKNIKHYALDSSGILVYSSNGEGRGSYRKCVPRKFRKIVLSECHDSLWSGGHLGRDKTKDKLRDNYYFSRMDQYADIWIKTCTICLSTKRKHPSKLQVPLGTITAHFTWELLSIDLWDAEVISDRGHKYVLTVIDAFSKFALAIPVKNKLAKTIASKLFKHVFSKFGYPDYLHSDNGSEFCNDILKSLCEMLGIAKTHTTAYHPQGNAYAERIHQFFRNALAAFVGRDQRDWDLLIPALVNVYLESIHSALGGYTPAQVMFGRQMKNPTTPETEVKVFSETNVPAYVAKLKLALDRAQDVISRIVKEKQFKNIQPSLGKLTLSYKIGDKVGLQVESLPAGVKSTKLFPRYSGPYTVTKATQDGKVLYLTDINGKQRKVPVSILKVKPWPNRQQLLEQFENFEKLKHQKSKAKATINSIPKDYSKSNNMDVVGEKNLKKSSKENERKLTYDLKKDFMKDPSDPKIYSNIPANLEYNDEDYDLFGNLTSKALEKVEAASHTMFMIEPVEHYRHRAIVKPAKIPAASLDLDILFFDLEGPEVMIIDDVICTNIII
jgi:hypothetical protein